MTTYEVEKFGRDTQGQWFGFGARRFAAFADARAYFESFAAEQRDVLDNGLRIDLRERRGRRLLARVGGCNVDPTTIRDIADLCECGCGQPATTTVRLLREQDRGTAEALGWAELSIAPMRVPVRIVKGHDADGIDGYVTDEDQAQ